MVNGESEAHLLVEVMQKGRVGEGKRERDGSCVSGSNGKRQSNLARARCEATPGHSPGVAAPAKHHRLHVSPGTVT